MNSLETAHAGVASGVNNTIARAAGLVAVAALGLILSTVFYRTYDAATRSAALAPQTRATLARERSRLITGYVPARVAQGDRERVRSIVDGAFLAGFAWAMGTAALLAGGAGLIAKFSFRRAS